MDSIVVFRSRDNVSVLSRCDSWALGFNTMVTRLVSVSTQMTWPPLQPQYNLLSAVQQWLIGSHLSFFSPETEQSKNTHVHNFNHLKGFWCDRIHVVLIHDDDLKLFVIIFFVFNYMMIIYLYDDYLFFCSWNHKCCSLIDSATHHLFSCRKWVA